MSQRFAIFSNSAFFTRRIGEPESRNRRTRLVNRVKKRGEKDTPASENLDYMGKNLELQTLHERRKAPSAVWDCVSEKR